MVIMQRQQLVELSGIKSSGKKKQKKHNDGTGARAENDRRVAQAADSSPVAAADGAAVGSNSAGVQSEVAKSKKKKKKHKDRKKKDKDRNEAAAEDDKVRACVFNTLLFRK